MSMVAIEAMTASALTAANLPGSSHVGEHQHIVKADNDLVVAGYASVELVDKQGDLITRDALSDAFDGFMKGDKYRNVQLAHSNIQVGEVIDSYIDSDGRMWKSGCDDTGMFVVVIKLRR